MTSSPPSSELSPAVSPESPPLRAGNWQQGLRSLRDLTQHLTTRADDNHAPPVSTSPKGHHVSMTLVGCQALVRFFALRRIKPHAPLLVRAPSIPLSFNLAAVLPRRSTYRVSCATKISRIPTASRHRLRRGLPGYLILFAPHAFAPQCQYQSRWSPSPLVFLPISTHFTATQEIPPPSTVL